MYLIHSALVSQENKLHKPSVDEFALHTSGDLVTVLSFVVLAATALVTVILEPSLLAYNRAVHRIAKRPQNEDRAR